MSCHSLRIEIRKARTRVCRVDPDALRAELEEKLRANRSPFPRAEGFGVQELIYPRETRPFLCDWIEWIQVRLEGLKGPVTFNMRP